MNNILKEISGSILVFLLALGVILTWSLFFGWLLSLLLPLTLFEGGLLVMIASIAIFHAILNSSPNLIYEDQFQEEDDDDNEWAIPLSTFAPTENDLTWESWVHHYLANEFYYHFPEDTEDREKWAIHISGAAIAVLKRKSERAPIRLTANQLRRQLDKTDMSPDSDLLLAELTELVNGFTSLPPVTDIIQQKKWVKPVTEAPILF